MRSIGKEPHLLTTQKSCVRLAGECFTKCRSNSECLSFGIHSKAKECSGHLQCWQYSEVQVADLHSNDDFSYYILVSCKILFALMESPKVV